MHDTHPSSQRAPDQTALDRAALNKTALDRATLDPVALDPAALDTNAVLACLQQQLGCYRQLAKLAARQHDHVQNEQTEALLEVLKEREVLLDRIATLEKTVGPAKRNWPGFTSKLDSPSRRTADAMLTETRSLLAEITDGDEKDALALQHRKHRLSGEIKATGSATVVNRSYAASAYGRPRSSSLDQHT